MQLPAEAETMTTILKLAANFSLCLSYICFFFPRVFFYCTRKLNAGNQHDPHSTSNPKTQMARWLAQGGRY